MKGWELFANNLMLIVGLGLILMGCWKFSPAIALIVTGVLCAGVATIKGLRNAESR